MTKTCTGCGQEMAVMFFYTKKNGKPTAKCKQCVRADSASWRARDGNSERNAINAKKWREENLDRSRFLARDWQRRNPDKKKANDKAWVAENREKSRVYTKKWASKNRELMNEYGRNWAKKNPHKICSKAQRRAAAKLKAIPPWADMQRINAIYAEAKRMSRETGCEFHVDHIVPLRSKFVCGLHVENNLRVIERKENLAKSNREWPEMP